MKRLIVGISGASGAIVGVRLLEALKAMQVETHLVLTPWAEATIKLETGQKAKDVAALATCVHNIANQAASIASGSFPVDGMVIVPCSMKRWPIFVMVWLMIFSVEQRMSRLRRGANWCW